VVQYFLFSQKIQEKGKPAVVAGFKKLLAYLDSNQDKQNQNLSYYHYTIGQSVFKIPAEAGKKECKNKVWQSMYQKNFN
jgi:hypothetical protein